MKCYNHLCNNLAQYSDGNCLLGGEYVLECYMRTRFKRFDTQIRKLNRYQDDKDWWKAFKKEVMG